MPRAVILLSGGLDSATVLAVARSEGFDVFALSVDYGQRHRNELKLAVEQARLQLAVEHRVVTIDLRAIGGSALTADVDVPKHRDTETMSRDIPITYVPARNTVLLSLCLGYAEVVGAFDLFIGANAVDYSGYPDCRPEFLKSFEDTANLATAAAVEGRGRYLIHAPLLSLTKAEIIKLGLRLGVNYKWTWSCYDPGETGKPCGLCDSCLLRAKGFAEAAVADPAI